ncbi:MAG: helix-turn-helix domain-containing protein [Tabrizicola sp.]|nr:helix-turn-helix domain-containing protein [Tabrizicola sp.]
MAYALDLQDGGYSGDLFGKAARTLFGSIRQRFLGQDERALPILSFASVGACGLTRITAPAHGVATPDRRKASNDPDFIKVLVQLHGSSTFRQSDRKTAIQPNTAIIYDPVRPYFLINATRVEQLILQIPREDIGDRNLRALSQPLVLPDEGPGQSRTIAAFIRATADSAPHLNAEMRAALGQSLAAFAKGLVSDHFRTDMIESMERASLILLRERVVSFVAQNLGNSDLGIETIARRMGCSVRYLHRAFEMQDTTLQKLVWKMRLDKSRALLEQTGPARESISDIAIRCGFSSSSHFSRLFGQSFGMSPVVVRAGQGQLAAR